MSDTLENSSLDALHTAYNVFQFTVEVLAVAAEKQCELMGDFNTAWELREDASVGRYLIDSGLFTDHQEAALLKFFDAMESVPIKEMPGGSGRNPNLIAMQNSAWEP